MIELCNIPKEIFKPFIDTICNFKKEVELNLDPDLGNITLRTMDTAKVALLEMELLIKPNELTSFQIPLGSIEKAVPKKDDVKLYHNGANITIVIDGMKFNIKTLDPRTSGLKPAPSPNVTYPTVVNLTKDNLEQINSLFKIVSNYTDNVIFEVKEGQLSITANLTTEDNVEKPIEVPVNGPDCRSRIPAEYLKDTFENCKLYDSAELSMGTNIPLKIKLSSNFIQSTIMIAPRIQDEDQ
ncbi:MAG: hypothetical protein WC877_01055 [Dehalococcoidales bacterium]|jgi:DNA polymerase III sliding clamp (beta) subunit (PCNA family)